ncbi:MAG: hypothetical protein AAGI91_12985 [Bacteroidota bacterium]
MTRRSVSRFLLAVLCALGGGLVIRACIAPGDERGFVDFGEGWDADELRHKAFRLDRPTRIAVSATGSFETDSALAAYGWVVRREDRGVVWQMTAQNAARERGTLALAADTLTLAAGTYDAYFTSYGDPLLRVRGEDSFGERLAQLLRFGNRAWTSDASKWRFRFYLAGSPGVGVRELEGDARDATPSGPDLVWASADADRGEVRSHVFEVRRPAQVRVEATGEIFNGPVDTGWIDNLSTGERVWTMDDANTAWAGGSVKNRRSSGTLALAPGLYRATFEADGSHHPGRWRANPPLDPAAYGLFLYAEPESVAAFDPWNSLPKVVEMTGVGDDALETAMFTLDAPLQAWVYAAGEMTRSSSYDYAWLIRDGEGVVWEMDHARTRHAGGADRNRIEEASLTLAPGRYTLHVETDGSHSPDGWHGDEPERPERWGVTLFALNPRFAPVAVDRRSEREHGGPASLPASGTAELPIRLAPLGNDQQVERTFTLDEETDLRVYALGEILPSGRFDYGWITSEDDHVWEMTRSNTRSGGGARKNRVFDGTVRLPAGTYTVHFKTDDSHAFGRFNEGSPTDPSAWGITVERAAPPPPAPPAVADTSSAVPPPPPAPANPAVRDA